MEAVPLGLIEVDPVEAGAIVPAPLEDEGRWLEAVEAALLEDIGIERPVLAISPGKIVEDVLEAGRPVGQTLETPVSIVTVEATFTAYPET